MKKKLLVFLITFFSSLIFLNKVNAQTCTSQYNISYYGFESVENSANYESIMENMLTYFENQNTYENYIIMYTTPNSSVQQIKMILFNGRGTIYWSNTTTLRWHSDNQNIQIYTASNIYNSSPSYSTSNNSTYSYVLWGTAYPPTYTSSIVFIDTNTTNFKYDDWDHATCLRSADNTYMELYGEVTMPIYGYNQTPEISFTYNSYTNNNKVYKGIVNIDFKVYDNESYIYQILNSYNNTWENIILETSYDVTFYKNGYLGARVIDKSDGNVIDQKTYNIVNIENDFDIIFNQSNYYDFNNQATGTNLSISYYSMNENEFIYVYDIYVNSDNTLYPKQIVGGNVEILYLSENSTVTAYIYDINDTSFTNVLYSKAYSINDIDNIPKITMEADDPRIVDGHYRIAVGISFGNYIPTKYKYEYAYKYDNSNNQTIYWSEWNDQVPRLYVDMELNGLVLAKVTRISDNQIIDEATYYVTGLENNFDKGIDITERFNLITADENWRRLMSTFNNTYIKLRESSNINFYIIIIISTSGIILIFKHFKK